MTVRPGMIAVGRCPSVVRVPPRWLALDGPCIHPAASGTAATFGTLPIGTTRPAQPR